MTPTVAGQRVMFRRGHACRRGRVFDGRAARRDVYLHGRFETIGGLQRLGLPRSNVGRKQPDEYRVVVLGGSAAYGYGVTCRPGDSAVLEQALCASTGVAGLHSRESRLQQRRRVLVQATLEDYAWLDYDLALFYEGYNDLMATAGPTRRSSGTTRPCSGSPATCRSSQSSSRKRPR